MKTYREFIMESKEESILEYLLSGVEESVSFGLEMMNLQKIKFPKELTDLFDLCKVHYKGTFKNQKHKMDYFDFLTNDVIDLSFCKLKTIPEIIKKTNFEGYWLQHNYLESIDNLPHKTIHHLDISNNNLESLESLKQYPNIKSIDVSGNPKKFMRDEVLNCVNGIDENESAFSIIV